MKKPLTVVEAGRKGGSATSERKKASSRQNLSNVTLEQRQANAAKAREARKKQKEKEKS